MSASGAQSAADWSRRVSGLGLLRFGPPDAERPGLVLPPLRGEHGLGPLEPGADAFDVSAVVSDYDEAFFARGGIAELRAQLLAGGAQAFPQVDLGAVRLGPPIARPSKLVAVGLNYRAHADEMAAELLPTEKEMPGMLRRLTLAGQQCGVIFDSFRPGGDIVKDHYVEVPIEVVVKGGYHQVGQFLAEVSNMPRIMKVSNLQILSDKKIEDDITTEARFTITAYTLNPNAPGAAAPAGAAAPTPNPGGTNAH